jgi:hypothetical protein
MSAEQRGPAICNVSNIGEGKDEMTKASIDLQDLRRRIYVKAKAEPSWRFWGLGPISFGVKQMGARNAGNPHVACDVEGAGDVAWSR